MYDIDVNNNFNHLVSLSSASKYYLELHLVNGYKKELKNPRGIKKNQIESSIAEQNNIKVTKINYDDRLLFMIVAMDFYC